jgi:hypothetical protein
LGTVLDFLLAYVCFEAISTSGIQERELKPFLTIFGTGMRRLALVSPATA